MNTNRRIGILVGAIYLAGFLVGIVGNTLIQSILGAPNYLSTVSAHSMTLAIGAMLWLMAAAGDAAHGVLMFPVLRQYNERIAFGYLSSRIVDAVFIAIMALFILLQIPLATEYLKAAANDAVDLRAMSTVSGQVSQYAYDIAMSALGIAGLILCYAFYVTKMVPRWIAVWGLAGYAIIFFGMVSEIMGFGLGLASSIPGGVWEVFIGVWLIVKGFNSSASVSKIDKAIS